MISSSSIYAEQNEKALEMLARRAAIKIGLVAVKSRRLLGTADNLGRFQLLEPRTNTNDT